MTISEAREIRPTHSDVGDSFEIVSFMPASKIGDHSQFEISGQIHPAPDNKEIKDKVYRAGHDSLGLIAVKIFYEPKGDGPRVDREIDAYLDLDESDNDFKVLDLGVTQAFNEKRRYVASRFVHRGWLYDLEPSLAASNLAIDIRPAPILRAVEAA